MDNTTHCGDKKKSYTKFLQSKVVTAASSGFDAADSDLTAGLSESGGRKTRNANPV